MFKHRCLHAFTLVLSNLYINIYISWHVGKYLLFIREDIKKNKSKLNQF